MNILDKKSQLIVASVCLLTLLSIYIFSIAKQETAYNPAKHQHIDIPLSAAEKAWLAKHPTIRVGASHNWKPIEFFSDSGQFRGISIDYLKHLELDLGVKFVPYHLNDAPSSESVDMLSAVPHAQALHGVGFDLLSPYIEAPYAIYTHQRNKTIHNFADLKHKRVAIYKHSPLVGDFHAKHPEITLLKIDLAEEAFDALAYDHVDAYLGNELVVDYHAGIHAVDYLRKVGTYDDKAQISMAVRSDWPELTSILNKSFKALEPQQAQILSRWQVSNQFQQNTYLILAIAGLLLIGAILLLRAYLLNQSLKAQEKSAQELIWRQANYDYLTDLPNRMMFNRLLEKTIASSAQHGTHFGLLFIDLDDFKPVNDRYGHLMGDQLIKEVSQRIARALSESDSLARFAGDEFTVLLTKVEDERCVARVASAIIKSMDRPFFIDKTTVNITVSIGAAIYPNHTTQLNTLIKYADQAMYQAKHNGRNQFKLFNKSMDFADTTRINIGQDLKNCIKYKQLKLYYQPIISLSTGKVVKAEALLRWEHPSMGLMTPDFFIHIAEENGMIQKIGQWVFNQALEDLPNLVAIYGEGFQIGVNVSPRQFGVVNHIELWPSLFKAANTAGGSICIEITESTFLNKDQSVIELLQKLREANILVSIDDFGTGYSSLSYLKNFNVDFIKLDSHFVSGISDKKQDLILCESIIQMAHNLGIKVIAEWIETKKQRDILVKLGCDYGQGYLFSPAKSIDELTALASPQ